MSEPRKILKREKIKKKDLLVYERIVSEVAGKDDKHYEIIIYGGGKSFVSITAKNLDLVIEVENWLNTQR